MVGDHVADRRRLGDRHPIRDGHRLPRLQRIGPLDQAIAVILGGAPDGLPQTGGERAADELDDGCARQEIAHVDQAGPVAVVDGHQGIGQGFPGQRPDLVHGLGRAADIGADDQGAGLPAPDLAAEQVSDGQVVGEGGPGVHLRADIQRIGDGDRLVRLQFPLPEQPSIAVIRGRVPGNLAPGRGQRLANERGRCGAGQVVHQPRHGRRSAGVPPHQGIAQGIARRDLCGAPALERGGQVRRAHHHGHRLRPDPGQGRLHEASLVGDRHALAHGVIQGHGIRDRHRVGGVQGALPGQQAVAIVGGGVVHHLAQGRSERAGDQR